MALLRDIFTVARAAGALNNTDAEPGPGKRLVTDVESKIFTLGGRLRGGGQDTPVWGESKVVWTDAGGGGFARATGRTVVGLLLPEDTIVTADIAFGWASATDIGDPRTDGLGFLTESGGEIDIIVPGTTERLRSTAAWNMRPMQYLIGITLNDVGAVYWISTFGKVTSAVGNHTYSDIPQFPLANILWVDNTDATATLFPYIQYYGVLTYPNGNSLEDLRVLDVAGWSTADAVAAFSDRFTRDDSAIEVGNGWVADPTGTWGISNNQAYYVARISGNPHYVVHDTGLADGNGIFKWDWVCPTAGTPFFFLYWRYQDTDNYYKITNDGGNNLRIYRVIAGAATNFWSVAQTWTPGQTYKFTLIADGNHTLFALDDVIKVNTTSASWGYLTDATDFGFGEMTSPKEGERWDNIAAYPLQTTLPIDFYDAAIPVVLVTGSTIAQDSFTGVDGTLLPDHTAEAGGVWTADHGTLPPNPLSVWQITGNQADPVTPTIGIFHVYQELGTWNAEAQVTMTIPNPIPGDSLLTGIVFRYVDEDNWMAARITRMYYAPNADEVELISTVGGVNSVVHKINLGAFNEAGDVRTLKVQAYDDLIQIFLEGEPIISYYTTDDDPLGTKWGLHVDRRTEIIGDEGVLFDTWIVKDFYPVYLQERSSMNIEEAIYSYLTIHPTVSELAGSRGYPMTIPATAGGAGPQTERMPCYAYQVISQTEMMDHDGQSKLFTTRVQFTCQAGSYGESKELARAISKVLRGRKGLMGDLWVESGEVLNEFDGYGAVGGVYTTRVDVGLMYRS